MKAFHYEEPGTPQGPSSTASFAKHLKALPWRAPFQAIQAAWTKDPSPFKINPAPSYPETKHLGSVSLFCGTGRECRSRDCSGIAHSCCLAIVQAERMGCLSNSADGRRGFRPPTPVGQVRVNRPRFGRGCHALPGVLVAMTIATSPLPVSAETLESAMARAYVGNPSLNAQRASTRATDENVPRALSGYRPRVNATADVGAQFSRIRDPRPAQPRDADRHANTTTVTRTAPRGVGVTVDQTLFNGFRTYNSVQQAESLVLGSRETLRSTEQDVLFNGAHRLYGRAARHGEPQPPAQQRRGPRGAAAADARPLQRRRGDPHRRCPGRSRGSPRRVRRSAPRNRTCGRASPGSGRSSASSRASSRPGARSTGWFR